MLITSFLIQTFGPPNCLATDEVKPTDSYQTCQGVKLLSAEEAARETPIRLLGVVTSMPQGWKGFFLQDESGGVYCEAANAEAEAGFWPVHVGEQLTLEAITAKGDVNSFVRVLRVQNCEASKIPEPPLQNVDDIDIARADANLVRFRGHIVRMVNIAGQMLYSIQGERQSARIVHDGFRIDPRVEDFAEVEICGVVLLQKEGEDDFKVSVPSAECFKLLRTHLQVLEQSSPVETSAILSKSSYTGQILRIHGNVFGMTESNLWVTDSRTGIECRLKPGLKATGKFVDVIGSLRIQGSSRQLEDAVLLEAKNKIREIPTQFTRAENELLTHQLLKIEGRFLDHFIADSQVKLSFQTDAGRLQCRLLNIPTSTGVFLEYGATYDIEGLLIPASAGEYSVRELLVRSREGFQKTANAPWPPHVTISIVTGLSMCLSAGLIASWRLYKNANESRLRLEQVREELHITNEQLERRVVVRTEELQQSNQRLQAEVKNRQIAEADAVSALKRMEEAQAIARVGSFSLKFSSGQMFWSLQAYLLHGLDAHEPAPPLDNYISSVHPEDRQPLQHFIQAAAESRNPVGLRYRYVGNATPVKWIHCSARQVASNHQKDVLMIEGTFQDVSEQIATEERVRQSQKMDAIGRLAGGVAHDLNNTLTAILMNCHLLEATQDLIPEISSHLSMIENAAEKSATLTRQLLMFSRKQAIHPTQIDISQLIRNFLPLLKQFAGEYAVLETELSDSLETVRLDSGQLEQILLNLVVNARDAIDGQGTILLRTADVYITQSDSEGWIIAPSTGQYVAVSVTDTGAGIPAAILDHVFDPFFTTKLPGSGTGLGLAVVHGIVQQNSGGLRVTSRIGSGTSFEILFPASTDAANSFGNQNPATISREVDSPHISGPLIPGTGTLLFVDDEEMVLRQTAKALEFLGYKVHATGSALQAIEIVESDQKIDLLITDYAMPELTGTQLIQRVRRIRPEMPTLLMSGFLNEESFLNLPTPTETAYLQKPYSLLQLSLVVHRLLTQQTSVTT